MEKCFRQPGRSVASIGEQNKTTSACLNSRKNPELLISLHVRLTGGCEEAWRESRHTQGEQAKSTQSGAEPGRQTHNLPVAAWHRKHSSLAQNIIKHCDFSSEISELPLLRHHPEFLEVQTSWTHHTEVFQMNRILVVKV